LVTEGDAKAEVAQAGTDPGGQVMHARFVLKWLADDLDALPLWNGGPENLHVTDGAAFAHQDAEIEKVHSWAMLAEWHHPWPEGDAAPADPRIASGSARGAVQLLDWVCEVTAGGPLTGMRIGLGRPSLYQVSLEVRSAMAGLVQAREAGDPVVAGRIEAIMDTFAWLAGWSSVPPVDRHGHVLADDCAERDAPCECDEAGCLLVGCRACYRVPCVHGFGQDIAI